MVFSLQCIGMIVGNLDPIKWKYKKSALCLWPRGRYECGKNALETKPMQFIYKIASNYLELLH